MGAQHLNPDLIIGLAFTVLCALLGVIWWEIRGLRKSAHTLTNRLTAVMGRLGLIEHRVKRLEGERLPK